MLESKSQQIHRHYESQNVIIKKKKIPRKFYKKSTTFSEIVLLIEIEYKIISASKLIKFVVLFISIKRHNFMV